MDPDAIRGLKRQYQRNPVVTATPLCCPSCDGLSSRVLRTDAQRQNALTVGGRTFPGQVRRRVECLDCGQHYMVISPLAKSQNARI